MNIQFSIIGLAIIVVFYLFTAGVLVLIGLRIKDNRWRKIIITLLAFIALLLPWVDEVLTAWNFRKICNDAGEKIARTVRVEGFYDDTGTGTSTPGPVTGVQRIEALENSGYTFREARLVDGTISRVEKSNGGWHQTKLDKPSARYHFRRPMNEADAGRAASCSEEVVVDTHENETIASYRYCKRYASFPERIWLGLIHRGPIEYCPSGSKELKDFLYKYVLLPTNKR